VSEIRSIAEWERLARVSQERAYKRRAAVVRRRRIFRYGRVGVILGVVGVTLGLLIALLA
jgi:hypothetical protein